MAFADYDRHTTVSQSSFLINKQGQRIFTVMTSVNFSPVIHFRTVGDRNISLGFWVGHGRIIKGHQLKTHVWGCLGFSVTGNDTIRDQEQELSVIGVVGHRERLDGAPDTLRVLRVAGDEHDRVEIIADLDILLVDGGAGCHGALDTRHFHCLIRKDGRCPRSRRRSCG